MLQYKSIAFTAKVGHGRNLDSHRDYLESIFILVESEINNWFLSHFVKKLFQIVFDLKKNTPQKLLFLYSLSMSISIHPTLSITNPAFWLATQPLSIRDGERLGKMKINLKKYGSKLSFRRGFRGIFREFVASVAGS